MPLHHDIVSRCCDCFNCPLPVTTLIWGTVIKMKCWSFIVTTSSVTLFLFWRCKRFFNNSRSKYNCTRASLVRIFCLFDLHSYLWEFCGFSNDTTVLYDTSRTKKQFDPRQDSNACPTILNDFLCILFYENGKWIISQPHHFSTNFDSYL